MIMRLAVTLVVMGWLGAARAQVDLVLYGEPYFSGNMAFSVTAEASIGQGVLLAYGLDPLDPPIQTGKGPYHIGNLVVVLPLGTVPPSGRIDVPFSMPPEDPLLVGIPLVAQCLASGQLSNPALLNLDLPYLQPSSATLIAPQIPSLSASFGTSLAAGDLNGDGHEDLVVSAAKQDMPGIDIAGAVYVLWGPDSTALTALESPEPVALGLFGGGVLVADVDADGTDDLVVSETAGNPALPGRHARLYVYSGGGALGSLPDRVIESLGSGSEYIQFGGGEALAAGDVDGDGDVDLLVGVWNASEGVVTTAGAVEVFFGPAFTETQRVANPTPATSDFFGTSIACADIDGDGIADLIEGSGRDDSGGVVNIGSVHVFKGPDLELSQVLESPMPAGFNTRFGERVLGTDLDGDGTAEVVAVDLKNHVFVFGGPSLALQTVVTKPQALNTLSINSVTFGLALAARDVNGDGFADMLIGDPVEGTPASTCSGTLGEGTLFAALGPYYSTFVVLTSPTAACGDLFAGALCTTEGGLLVSTPTHDIGSVENAGSVVSFELSGRD